jgi:hypothetical protein
MGAENQEEAEDLMDQRPSDIVKISALYWVLAAVVLVVAVYILQFTVAALVLLPLVLIGLLLGYGFWTGADWAYELAVRHGGFWGALFDTGEVEEWFGVSSEEERGEIEGDEEQGWSGD